MPIVDGVPAREGVLERPGASIHFQVFGDSGPALVLLPTWSLVHTDFWRRQVPHFEGRFRLVPPTPRGMIIPPANDALRGTTVEVWVFVDEQGRGVPDSTRLNPPTKDRRFNQRLIREASEWVFRPAQQAGKAVASWFPYQISM